MMTPATGGRDCNGTTVVNLRLILFNFYHTIFIDGRCPPLLDFRPFRTFNFQVRKARQSLEWSNASFNNLRLRKII